MKEETKSKLRKFGKVTAYGFGLFAMLLLGVGLGNCSAKDKPAKANAEAGLSLADQKTLQRKRALDPAEYRTLGENENNLLRDSSAGHLRFSYVEDGPYGTGLQIGSASYQDAYLLKLSAGVYVLDATNSDNSWFGAYYFLNDYGADQVQRAIAGEDMTHRFIERADYSDDYNSILNAQGGRRYFLTITADFPWGLFYCSNIDGAISLSLYEPLKAPAVASFDFPVIFNPYPLGGSPANGDFIFNGPSVNAVETDSLQFNGLSFRSNGKLYDSIMLTFTHDQNQTFGHYDASGNFVLDGTLGASAWYFRNMIYRYGTQYADVVWNAKYESVDSNLAWKPALVSGGLWVNQEYRHIEVLSFVGSTLNGLPSTSLVLNSSVESVLKLLASYVPPSTAEMGNPFTLIREGFTAVGGILQIQILPFMTLGTLIFVPLVVLVILAILKLLAK